MHGYKLFLPLVFLMTIFSGCSFQDLEFKGVEGMEVESLEGSKLKGVMRVKILNPNSFPITVTKADLEVFASNVRLGDAHLGKNLRISANSEKAYDVRIDANVGNLLTGGLGSIMNMLSGKSPSVTLEGEVKARSFFISKTVPVKLETTLPLNR